MDENSVILTPIENDFLNAISKICMDYDFLLGMLHLADDDKLKQKIIDGVNNGTLKTYDDVVEVTKNVK